MTRSFGAADRAGESVRNEMKQKLKLEHLDRWWSGLCCAARIGFCKKKKLVARKDQGWWSLYGAILEAFVAHLTLIKTETNGELWISSSWASSHHPGSRGEIWLLGEERRDYHQYSPLWNYAGTAQLRQVFISPPQQSDGGKKWEFRWGWRNLLV